MPGPVCSNCKLEMRASKNGVMALQNDTDGKPYRVWMADEYACVECSNKILTGWGMNPVSTRHEDAFANFKSLAERDFTT